MSSVDDLKEGLLQHLLFLLFKSLKHCRSSIQQLISLDPCMLERRKERKVTRCGFVCSRVVLRLELVHDVSTVTFIQALKRFSARRGLPRRILSDNAKTFKAAAKLLKIIFGCQEVKDYLELNGCSILRRHR